MGERALGEGHNSRHHTAIDQDASLKLDQIRMLGRAEGVLADQRSAPAVDGDVELSPRVERGDEAGHGWYSKCAPVVGELVVWDDMTADLELLQRDTSIAVLPGGEEQNVPVVVTHGRGQMAGEER